jgi:hypothetical protein
VMTDMRHTKSERVAKGKGRAARVSGVSECSLLHVSIDVV